MKNTSKESIPRKKSIEEDIPSLLPTNYIRDEDPAVRRLKELRRKEQIKNGEFAKKHKKTNPSTTTKRKSKKDDDNLAADGYSRFKKKLGSTHTRPTPVRTLTRKMEPIKKISFDELMKQAENNASSKESSEGISKKESPSASRPHLHKPGFRSARDRNRVSKPVKHQTTLPRKKMSLSPIRNRPGSRDATPIKISLPVAQPNQRLKQRLESKRQRPSGRDRYGRPEYDYDDEDDMDDFIEDDEEDSEVHRRMKLHRDDPGYDRDEIWAMFNKGRKRSEYAYDEEEDDMEANEMEILEEEERAEEMARLEDKREAAWLKKHEEEKRRKLKK